MKLGADRAPGTLAARYMLALSSMFFAASR